MNHRTRLSPLLAGVGLVSPPSPIPWPPDPSRGSLVIVGGGDRSEAMLGESAVVIYDARRAHVTERKKPLLGATGLRVHVLPAGAVFDLRTGGGDL